MSNSSGSTSEVLELAEKACEGELTDRQAARLDALLGDRALRQAYVQFLWMDGLLELAESEVAPTWADRPGRLDARRRRLSAAGAAALVVCVLAAVWIFRPPVARIVAVASDSVVTDAAGRRVVAGAAFQSGRVLHVGSGLAELELTQGARVRVRGPAALQMKSRNACRLLHGTLVADVPPPAIGFRVYTGQGLVEDFGTTFSVQALAESSAVSVLAGQVEVAGPAGKAQVGALTVARLDGSGADIVEQRFDIESFAVDPSLVAGIERIDGAILVFDLAPPQIAPGALENDENTLVFVEKAGVRRDPAWPLDLLPESAPAGGELVDSFLLHFDPSKDARPDPVYARCRGRIRFRRPIVGVIVNPETLATTDLACGRSAFDFPKATRLRRSAFWDAERENDLIAVESDGHTLRFELLADGNTLSGLDQFRVLVAADPAQQQPNGGPRR